MQQKNRNVINDQSFQSMNSNPIVWVTTYKSCKIKYQTLLPNWRFQQIIQISIRNPYKISRSSSHDSHGFGEHFWHFLWLLSPNITSIVNCWRTNRLRSVDQKWMNTRRLNGGMSERTRGRDQSQFQSTLIHKSYGGHRVTIQ